MKVSIMHRRMACVVIVAAMLSFSTLVLAQDDFFPGWRSRSWPQTPHSSTVGPLTGWHLVIDPGHGGTEPGASGFGIQEKVFTLAIGKRVEALLQNEGAQVTMTRTEDVTVSLQERVDLANSSGAHRFLSVHINACCGASGIETWVDAPGTDKTQHPTTADVWKAYAQAIHTGLVAGARTIDASVKDRGVKYSGTTGPWNPSRIFVLRDDRINIPSALVEINFIDTASDHALLIRDDYQQAVAIGITQGFLQHAQDYNPQDGLLK